jgi:hypothetical protein
MVISGELQFLCGIFERYTSNQTSFSTIFEENEDLEEEPESSPIVSKLRQTSISSQSSSPPNVSIRSVTPRQQHLQPVIILDRISKKNVMDHFKFLP